eukprot:gene30558-37796_t
MANVSLMVGVNIAYVYIHGNYSSNIVQITQIAVAAFKLSWNKFVVRNALKLSKSSGMSNKAVTSPSATPVDHHITTALVSSNCFNEVITTPESVTVSYLYRSCADFTTTNFDCMDYVVERQYSPQGGFLPLTQHSEAIGDPRHFWQQQHAAKETLEQNCSGARAMFLKS